MERKYLDRIQDLYIMLAKPPCAGAECSLGRTSPDGAVIFVCGIRFGLPLSGASGIFFGSDEAE